MDVLQTEVLIEAKGLEFEYEQEEGMALAIAGLDMSVKKGSFVAVVGSNGSGKSTLAKNMNAILLPSGGKMYVAGMDTADEEKTLDIRRTVGMVFQNPDNQLVSSIVEDDVAFGPENLGVEPPEIRLRVEASLMAVGMLDHRKKGPHLLSGGQKQRIAIAGVLAMEPSCIVFDEPTAMLDPMGRAEIMTIIKGLHEKGVTIVLITHFMEEAAEADLIYIMEKGKLVFTGTPAEAFGSGLCDVPFAAEVAEKLRAGGMDIPAGIYSEDELVEAICGSK